MQRIAFQLRVRAEMIAAYDEAHRHVWPELIEELQRFGVREYSIFRRGQQLFLYMHVENFAQLLTRLAESEVNRRWQQQMAPLFEPVPYIDASETFAMMTEVFYMPGAVGPE